MSRLRNPRCRRRQRGQALVETALVLILLLTAFMGVYATSTFASDQNSATTAVRSGARLGVEVGNNHYPANGNLPTSVDLKIVNTVCQLAEQMPFVVSIDEVDVYLPVHNPDGSYHPLDRVDRYDCKTPNTSLARPIPDPGLYVLSLRVQQHPLEALLGVRLKYQYHAPTPLLSVTATTSRYAVMAMEPQF